MLPEKEKILDKLELSLIHSRGDGSELRPGLGLFYVLYLYPMVPEGTLWTLFSLPQSPRHCPLGPRPDWSWQVGARIHQHLTARAGDRLAAPVS